MTGLGVGVSLGQQQMEILDTPYGFAPGAVERFRAEGWVRAPGLLDAETAGEMYRRFEGLYDSLRQEGQKGTAGDAYFKEGRYHRQHRIFQDPSRVDPVFRRVVLSERVASVARQLMGCDEAIYLRATVFEKPPASEDSLPTTLHQDFPYLPFDRSGSVQIWIALHDLPVESGPLRFVTGSHRRYGVVGRTNVLEDEQELLHARFGPFELSEPHGMAAGDATVHDDLTLHGADANAWDRPRRGFTVTYFRPDVKYTGAAYWVMDGLGLAVNEVVRHENFPLR
jgi:hypothetical protein